MRNLKIQLVTLTLQLHVIWAALLFYIISRYIFSSIYILFRTRFRRCHDLNFNYNSKNELTFLVSSAGLKDVKHIRSQIHILILMKKEEYTYAVVTWN